MVSNPPRRARRNIPTSFPWRRRCSAGVIDADGVVANKAIEMCIDLRGRVDEQVVIFLVDHILRDHGTRNERAAETAVNVDPRRAGSRRVKKVRTVTGDLVPGNDIVGKGIAGRMAVESYAGDAIVSEYIAGSPRCRKRARVRSRRRKGRLLHPLRVPETRYGMTGYWQWCCERRHCGSC